MRANDKEQRASFSNEDIYKVTFINRTKLPVYVIYGGAAKSGGHVAILYPNEPHAIDSFEEGEDIFKFLTKSFNDSESDRRGKATFKEDVGVHYAVFLGAATSYCKDRKPSDYMWKKETLP